MDVPTTVFLIHVACLVAATMTGKRWLVLFPLLFWPLFVVSQDVEAPVFNAVFSTLFGVAVILLGLFVHHVFVRDHGRASRR